MKYSFSRNQPVKIVLFALLLSIQLCCAYAIVWPEPSNKGIEFDELLASFSRRLGFSTRINPTPESQEREKEKFFNALALNIQYNPQFDYLDVSAEALKAAELLKNADPGSGVYSSFLHNARAEKLAQLNLLQRRGASNFTSISSRLNAIPSFSLVKNAYRVLLEMQPEFSELSVSTEEMVSHLQLALPKYGLEDWEIEVSRHMAARASVLPQSRKIRVRADTMFSQQDVTRLIIHEIGVHALRARYGHKAPLRLFTVGLADYLETEEGLAVYTEVRNNILTGMRLFALRVLAIHWARAYGFYEVYNRLVNHGADPETAWSITLRVKRGLVDTSQPGAYTKDAAYLRGYYIVKEYLEAGGCIDELMSFGKVGINDLPELRLLSRATVHAQECHLE